MLARGAVSNILPRIEIIQIPNSINSETKNDDVDKEKEKQKKKKKSFMFCILQNNVVTNHNAKNNLFVSVER